MEDTSPRPNTYKAVSCLIVYPDQLWFALSLHVNVNYINKAVIISETNLPYEPTEKSSWFKKEEPTMLYGEVDWVRIRHNTQYDVVNVQCQISIKDAVYKFDTFGKPTNECDNEKDKFYRLGVGIVVKTFYRYKDIPSTYQPWWRKLKIK